MEKTKWNSERRKFDRQELELAVQLRLVTSSDPIQLKNSFCLNISQVGLQIVSFDFYPVEGKVFMQLFSADNISLFKTVGRVVWVQQFPYQQKYKIGIEFVDNEVFKQELIGLMKKTSN